MRLTGDAYLWAAGGALLAYVTLLWPAYQATRHTVIQQRAATARPPKQSFFTRYYLDLALVGLGAILYYQLDRSGKLTTESVFGEQTIDPVRLLTPAFFILTIGIVFLRLFPLVLRLLSFGVSKGQGSAVMIGMWQLVRNPVHYSRLVLLLMLATAVGTFAASFGSTLNRSYDDRAAYASGSGLRISSIRTAPVSGPATLAPGLQEQTQAEAASPVMRLSGSPAAVGNQISRINFDVLGVDPDTIGDIGFFREDFAGGSMDDRFALIKRESGAETLAIPADARYLGLWFNPIELRGRVAIDIKLVDATGRYFSLPAGAGGGPGPGAGLALRRRRPRGAGAVVRGDELCAGGAARAVQLRLDLGALRHAGLGAGRGLPGRRLPDEHSATSRTLRHRQLGARQRPGAAAVRAVAGPDQLRLGRAVAADAGDDERAAERPAAQRQPAGGRGGGRAALAANGREPGEPWFAGARRKRAAAGAGEQVLPRRHDAGGRRQNDGRRQQRLPRGRDRRRL